MASMLEKLGAMFEEGADTTSVSISADVSVSEGTDTEVVETVDEVQDYVEASDEVEAATQEVEEVTEQMEQTVEAAETAAELRANISQYGLNKQAAALIYQFYGIDKVGSFVTPSVEAIDTVGRNYNAANQLMAALEEAEKSFKDRVKAAWNWIIEKLRKLADRIAEFLSPLTNRLKKAFDAVKRFATKGATYILPEKIILMNKLMTDANLEKLYNRAFKAANATEGFTEKDVEEANKKYEEFLELSRKPNDGKPISAREVATMVEQSMKKKAEEVKEAPGIIRRFIDWIKSLFNKKDAEDPAKQKEATNKTKTISTLNKLSFAYIKEWLKYLLNPKKYVKNFLDSVSDNPSDYSGSRTATNKDNKK